VEPLLHLHELSTRFRTTAGPVTAVDSLSLDLAPGTILGVVGESGSGKSTVALALLRLLPETAEVQASQAVFLGRNLLAMGSAELRALRGRELAMIFQEPMTSLNPVMRVGEQIAEALRLHAGLDRPQARARAIELLVEVGVADAAQRVDAWPHELSGGQKQRVMIAMALACDPKLLIADEPTTALDVTVQRQILELLARLRDERGMAILFITHDLGVVAELADRVAVMMHGAIVEEGEVLTVFEHPQHPYTRGLLACKPRLATPYRLLPTVADFVDADGGERALSPERDAALRRGLRDKLIHVDGEPLLSVRDLTVSFPAERSWTGRVARWRHVVRGLSFDLWPGQTLGLVGESGCGKTTTGRAVLRLIEPSGGEVRFDGRLLATCTPAELRGLRRQMQMVFQDPYASLNPRRTVEQALTEPMYVHGLAGTTAQRRERAASLLQEVGLEREHLTRYPHELSGGQRQRVCIARALSVEPSLLICDESVSSLDVSVQAQVLNLLKELQVRRGLAYIFISHDLSVVKFMSDTMAVMHDGLIVEAGPSEALYANPQHAYTRQLIDAVPRDDLLALRARIAARKETSS